MARRCWQRWTKVGTDFPEHSSPLYRAFKREFRQRSAFCWTTQQGQHFWRLKTSMDFCKDNPKSFTCCCLPLWGFVVPFEKWHSASLLPAQPGTLGLIPDHDDLNAWTRPEQQEGQGSESFTYDYFTECVVLQVGLSIHRLPLDTKITRCRHAGGVRHG